MINIHLKILNKKPIIIRKTTNPIKIRPKTNNYNNNNKKRQRQRHNNKRHNKNKNNYLVFFKLLKFVRFRLSSCGQLCFFRY